jgi:Leucine-rich repeat (LRR) protein
MGFWDVLVPFAQKVLEIVPDFYHQRKLKTAIRKHQIGYIKALFLHPQNSVELIRHLYYHDLHRTLQHNQLKSIPSEIGLLSNLRELYYHDLHRNLGSNHLTSIPPEIGQLSNLRELYHHDLHRYLEKNQLTSIPSEFGQLFKLKQLYIIFYIDGLTITN